MIAALVFYGACLSQQSRKSPKEPPGNAAQTDQPESPSKASKGTATFDVGKFPIGLVYDGMNIWVANAESNTVTKLRASDGAVLGTFTVGKFPVGVAFDGRNIWVANAEGNSVMKLRMSDGAALGTFNVGKKPGMVAFDGANIWVANEHSNNVMKLRVRDGAVLPQSGRRTSLGGVGRIGIRGRYLWSANPLCVWSAAAVRNSSFLTHVPILQLWTAETYRPTRDLDLLGRGVSNTSYRKIFSEVCSQEVEDDGLTFLPDTIRVERIRDDEAYEG